MHQYLLEIGTEEIPAKFMSSAMDQMREIAALQLGVYRFQYSEISAFGTPRRLALLISGLAEKGTDIIEEIKGPALKAAYSPEGKPTKVAEGFARAQKITVEELLVKNINGSDYVFAVRESKGSHAKDVLADVSLQLINNLNFPKPMRWADNEMRFARPIRWIVSILDEQIIPFKLGEIEAGRITRGHRFLGEDHISINDPKTYLEQLWNNFVMADHKKRRNECWKQIQTAAEKLGGIVVDDEELLNEVNFLLEWPTALTGNFDKHYLELPEEVVITPMREHQRYFPVRDNKGRLMNHFVTVRNGDEQYLENVRAGNEKVLKARLDDARFFWEEDKKIKLENYLPRLEKIIFQEKLGTVAQKIIRIEANVKSISEWLGKSENITEQALRAAKLAKADLVTYMVYEFPELQGIMGQYYADLSGENEAVAKAIKEHYQPRFAGDEIPQSIEGSLLSIADKIDTITGCFAIGIEPTGSQDPYALRRQVMGICLIITGHQLEISIDGLISLALNNYRSILGEKAVDPQIKQKIREFFRARIRNILVEQGYKNDTIDTVLEIDFDSLPDTFAKVSALEDAKNKPGYNELLTAFTRAYNLSKKSSGGKINEEYLLVTPEIVLNEKIHSTEKELAICVEKRDYIEAFKLLSQLAEPVNHFFDGVMVMVDDEKIRQNRLALLAKLVSISRCLGDLSKINSSEVTSKEE